MRCKVAAHMRRVMVTLREQQRRERTRNAMNQDQLREQAETSPSASDGPAVDQPRKGAIGKALLVYLGTGSIGVAIVAYLIFSGMGC